MLSLTCKTAIKAVLYLAAAAPEQRAGIKEIAAVIDASEHTVGKMLQTLVREDIIQSAKGPHGGFYMLPKQVNLPVINIVYAIDGEAVFSQCGLGLPACSASHPCPLHNDYKKVRDLFKEMCLQKKISDACRTVSGGKAFLVG